MFGDGANILYINGNLMFRGLYKEFNKVKYIILMRNFCCYNSVDNGNINNDY